MEQFAKIEFELEPTNASSNLGVEVWVDSAKIFDNQITETQHVEYRISDDDADHELKFVLKNKTDQDTQIDEVGNILKDSLINIKNIKVDGIDLGYMFNQLSQYTHNNNGHNDSVTEQFFGTMGCNGVVSFKFSTPIYLWMLENM